MICHSSDVFGFDNMQNQENKETKLYQALSTGSALKYLAFSTLTRAPDGRKLISICCTVFITEVYTTGSHWIDGYCMR